MSVSRIVEDLFRHESGRLVARLVRTFGPEHIDLVEDVVQETLVRALKHWSIKGIPEAPAAWLTATAKNLVLDELRRDATLRAKLPRLAPDDRPEPHDERDRLALMFACCDPSLPLESQIALTLHTLGGMSSTEIAGCLNTQPNAVEQRVSRAKRALRERGGPVELPDPDILPERLEAVLAVVYQVFAAGYSAHAGEEAVRIDLCADALHLLRLVLHDKATATPSAHALHAVLLFFAARIPGRTDDWGNVLRLEEQDRSTWDPMLVSLAFQEFEASMSGARVSPYHLEAAILAEHARAGSFASTNWGTILAHYTELELLDPSPIVRLNAAIAAGLAHGPQQGLDRLATLDDDPAVQRVSAYHAARARFLTESGRSSEARGALAKALDLAANQAERAHFSRLLAAS